jgi:SAM-dependent methyltransferase
MPRPARREIPGPLCGHAQPGGLVARGWRAVCRGCGSFWDLDSLGAEVRYDATYCASRLHDDARVGGLKVRTVLRWLDAQRIDVRGRVVCEVGFGGGYVLRGLAQRGAVVSGIEASPAARESARALGVAAEDLHDAERLPARLARPVDLWLFLDSFEHLPEPAAFLAWMAGSSRPGAQALLVAPDATSRSVRWLGPCWPHRLPDHRFHWSTAGLRGLWEGAGWEVCGAFVPTKLVSPATLFGHALLTLGACGGAPQRVLARMGFLQRLALPFNIGEQGVIFRRHPGEAAP